MPLSAKSLAGPGYIILNAMRVCNIICLLAVITASIVSLVKIKMTNQFFFFEAVTHVITLLVSGKSIQVSVVNIVTVLTINRFPDHLRAHNLPHLLCTTHASAEPSSRVCLPWSGYARTGRQHSCKPEQAFNE